MGLVQLSVNLTDSYHLTKGKLFLSPGCRGFCPWLFGPIQDFGLLVAHHGVKEETGVLEPLLKVLQLLVVPTLGTFLETLVSKLQGRCDGTCLESQPSEAGVGES